MEKIKNMLLFYKANDMLNFAAKHFRVLVYYIMVKPLQCGEYCKAYYDHNLEYHAGFYCEHFCCGLSGKKFCCNDVVYKIDEEIYKTNTANWPQT